MISERVSLGSLPTIGFGDGQITPPVAPVAGPWRLAIATSMLSAATGWAINEVASTVRGRRHR